MRVDRTTSRRGRAAGFLAAWGAASVLVGCAGTADDGAGPRPDATASNGPGTPDGSDLVGVALGGSCEHPAGFTVGHPVDWAVNAGETVAPCSRFAPSEFDVLEATDARVAATVFSVETLAFERLTAVRPDEVSRQVTTVDGQEAVRIEREAQVGLYPAGTPITSYAIRLPDSDDGPRTLVADTVGLDAFEYERNVEVLDAQVGSLQIEGSG